METIEWSEFKRLFRWKQGEHLSLIGKTQSGKTTLALELLKRRTYVCALCTKSRDDDFSSALEDNGFKFTRSWPISKRYNKVALWPPIEKITDAPEQEAVIKKALAHIYTVGGWTVYADEIWYLKNALHAQKYLEMLWSQGATIKITVVAGTQRPRTIPQMMLDQPVHLFFFRSQELKFIQRTAEISFLLQKEIISTVPRLEQHQFLYVNQDTGQMAVSKLER